MKTTGKAIVDEGALPDGSRFVVYGAHEGARLDYLADFDTFQEALDWSVRRIENNLSASKLFSCHVLEHKAFVTPEIQWGDPASVKDAGNVRPSQ